MKKIILSTFRKFYEEKRFTLLLFLNLLIIGNLIGQSIENCGFDQFMDYRNSQEPGLHLIDEALEQELQEMITIYNDPSRDADGIFEIPVVVHILHLGETDNTNISYAQIQSAISALEEDFSDGNGVNVEIEFCLAKRTPDGTPFTDPLEPGVFRVDASSITAADGAYGVDGMIAGSELETVLKAINPVRQLDYLNIWVVHEIKVKNTSGNVRGYSYFPFTTEPEIQGLVIKYNNFGTVGFLDPTRNENKVLTHEVGHYFSLYHTFEGDGDGAVCPGVLPNEGDKVEDTDPHIRSINDCVGDDDNECTDPVMPLEDVIFNYLNYNTEPCLLEFTNDQAVRMRCNILAFRPGLINSLGCELECSLSVGFAPNITSVETNGLIAFTNDSNGSVDERRWIVNGRDVNVSSVHYNTSFNAPGTYLICLQETVGSCTNEDCHEIEVTLAGCNATNTPNCEELINGNLELHQIPPNTDGLVPDPFHMEFQSNGELCNWERGKGSPYFCHQYDDEHIGLININGNIESITSMTDLNLSTGIEYYLSFEFLVARMRDEDPGENFRIQFYLGTGLDLNAYQLIYQENLSGYDIEFNSNNLNCAYFQNFHQRINIPFFFDGNSGKELLFRLYSESSQSSFYTNMLLVKNVSVKSCIPCEPDFLYTKIDGCNYSFESLGQGDFGTYEWTIDNQTITGEDLDYTFSSSGQYEVCLSYDCYGSITKTICKTIDVFGCDDCETTIVPVNAILCDDNDEERYLANIELTVPIGYTPCLGKSGYSSDALIQVNGSTVHPIDANNDLISISLDIIPNDPTDFNANGANGHLELCNEDGDRICFKLAISGTECTSCEGPPIQVLVYCNQAKGNSETNVYEGEINLGPVTGGSIHSNSSLISNVNPTLQLGDNILTFDVTANTGQNEISFIVSGKDQFQDDVCLLYEIVFVQCPVLPTDCFPNQWGPKLETCVNGDLVRGKVLFEFSHTVLSNGTFECLEGSFGRLEGANMEVETVFSGTDVTINISLYLDPQFITYTGEPNQILDMYIYLCNANGYSCFYFPTVFQCDVPRSDGRSRSFSENDKFNFILSPNPAVNELAIEIRSSKEDTYNVEFFSYSGQLIKTISLTKPNLVNTIDLIGFETGLYIVKATSNIDHLTVIKKLIVIE